MIFNALIKGSGEGGGTYQTKTVTPTAAGQTVSPDSGFDALSSVVLNGDENCAPENIRKDVSIFGQLGTYQGAGYLNPDVVMKPMDLVGVSTAFRVLAADCTAGQTFSSYSGTAASAFDDNTSTYWASTGITTNEYVQVQFSIAKQVQCLTMHPYASRGFKDFLLLASNNGTDWTELYRGSAPASGKTGFVFDNDTTYTYYRIQNNGTPWYASYIRMYEIELLEQDSGGTL